MTDINNIFFQLIQVSLGTRICLSHTPSADEWGELYSMAKKQSLIGVCFAGVQRLQTQQQEPPEMLYLTWMGMAAKIQQRNEVVNRQCVELQAKLAADGFKSVILKGQGVASLYSDHLRGLRQSGDIDVLVDAELSELLRYVNGIAPTNEVDRHHIHFDVFPAHLTSSGEHTEVELHYVPINHPNPWKNRRLQRWFAEAKKECVNVKLGDGEITTPSFEFNAVFMLMHIFHHFQNEGVGMRQLMDYYFVLQSTKGSRVQEVQEVQEVKKVFSDLGLERFASALMWVLLNVFEGNNHLKPAESNETLKPSETWLLWQPCEEDGRVLLDEVLKSGNFGKMAENDILKMGVQKRICHRLGKHFRLNRFERTHFLWSPLFSLGKKLWQIKYGYK